MHLRSTEHSISDLARDLGDGIYLAELLSILSMKPLDVNRRPRMRIQKLENLNIVLNFIKNDQGIRLVAIGPEDILDANIKLILGCALSKKSRNFAFPALNEDQSPLFGLELVLCWN